MKQPKERSLTKDEFATMKDRLYLAAASRKVVAKMAENIQARADFKELPHPNLWNKPIG